MSDQKLTEILGKGDLMFGLGKLLNRAGIPTNEPWKVAFKFNDKVVETSQLQSLKKSQATAAALSQTDLKDELVEFLNKTDVMFGLTEKLKEMGWAESSKGITMEVMHGQGFNNKMSVALYWCCPCPNPIRPCCWC
jgi:hypothetical protein